MYIVGYKNGCGEHGIQIFSRALGKIKHGSSCVCNIVSLMLTCFTKECIQKENCFSII